MKDTEISRFLNRKSVKNILGENFLPTAQQYTRLLKVLEYFGSTKRAENMHATIAIMLKNNLRNIVGRVKRLQGIPGTTKYTQLLRYGKQYWQQVYQQQSDKKTSHFKNTLAYWINQGMTHSEAVEAVRSVQKERAQRATLITTGVSLYSCRSIEFWISRGYSDEDAQSKVKQIQTTNGLEYYKSKYGEDDYIDKFNQRINKWKDTLAKNNDYAKLCLKKGHSVPALMHKGVSENDALSKYNAMCERLRKIRRLPSKVSQSLFDLVASKLGKSEVYYDSLNYEFLLNGYRVDFFHKASGTVVEFFGDFFHRNPTKFKADFVVHNLSSQERWNYDRARMAKIMQDSLVNDVIIVWESDFRKNPQQQADLIIERINGNRKRNNR